MDMDSFRGALEKEGAMVFSLKDAARVMHKPPGYARLFLSRLAKRGKIMRIERGKYCLQAAGELEVASNLAYPSYVSFLSALVFHKLSTQIPVRIQVACSRQKKSVRFGSAWIDFVSLKRNAFFGFRRFGNVFAAEPEKAVIDGLYAPKRLPLSEVFYALKQKGELDAEKLCEYARRLGSSVVKRRLGFLIEKAGISKGVELEFGKTTRYAPLNPLLGQEGEKNRKWMLRINEVLE